MTLRTHDLADARSLLASNKFSVLAGAGVSIPAPTCLPSGNELRDKALVGLLRGAHNADLVDRILENRDFQRMLPEAAFQELGYVLQAKIDTFVASYLGPRPHNLLHTAIAARFSHVFTTNFDLCFEKAGAERTFHLHGSAAVPESMQSRLWRLGQTAPDEMEQFVKRIAIDPLFVCGYSMRDRDVTQALANCASLRVVYLSHTGEVPPFVEKLSGDVTIVRGSLAELLQVDEKESLGVVAPPVGPRATMSEGALGLLYLATTLSDLDLAIEIVDRYAASLRGWSKLRALTLLAEAHREEQRFERAQRICVDGRKRRICSRPENLDIRSNFLAIDALCDLEGAGDVVSARKKLREAVRDMNRYGRLNEGPEIPRRVAVWKAKLANNLGNAERDLGRLRRAERLYRYSIAVKDRHGEELSAAQTLSNLAVLLIKESNFGGAITALRTVLERMTKSPEPYICRSAVFDNLSALSRHAGIPEDQIVFGRATSEAVFAKAEPVAAELITILRQLEQLSTN